MLTDDEILTLNIAVFDADGDNDVHVSAPDEDLLAFARVIERAAAERMRERCLAVCVAQASRWLTSPRDIYVAHECAQAIAAVKIKGETR